MQACTQPDSHKPKKPGLKKIRHAKFVNQCLCVALKRPFLPSRPPLWHKLEMSLTPGAPPVLLTEPRCYSADTPAPPRVNPRFKSPHSPKHSAEYEPVGGNRKWRPRQDSNLQQPA